MKNWVYSFAIRYDVTFGDIMEPEFGVLVNNDDLQQLQGNTEFVKGLRRLTKEAKNIFNIGEPDSTERKRHYKMCWGISGVKCVELRYMPTGYAKLTIATGHALSDTEKKQLDAAIEGQMIDGYGENAMDLFATNDGRAYFVVI